MILLFIVDVPAEIRTRRLPFYMQISEGKRIPDYWYDTLHLGEGSVGREG